MLSNREKSKICISKSKGSHLQKISDKLVSICMATYNGEMYLSQQLDSLISQTYKNIEVVVQDDCSSDKTLEVLNEYKERLNLKIYQNEKNLGFMQNFESVLKKAEGDFIAICDQDDIWESDKIELLLHNIEDSTLVYSDSMLIDENGNSLNQNFSSSLKNNFITTKNPLAFLNDNCVSGHAMLFKKDLLKYIFPFSQTVFFDAWIAANAATLDGVKYFNKPLVRYRQHGNNTLSKYNNKSKSVIDRISSKAQKKLENSDAKIARIDSFLKLVLLNDNEKMLLNELKVQYGKFQNSWFNFRLFNFLKSNQDKLFEITKKNINRLILKESIGYKLYKIAPFL